MVAVLNDAFELYSHSEMLELQRTFRDFLREASNLDDESLVTILQHEFGASYYAPWDGSTYRAWLEFVDKQLDETIAERMRLV